MAGKIRVSLFLNFINQVYFLLLIHFFYQVSFILNHHISSYPAVLCWHVYRYNMPIVILFFHLL